MKEWEKHLERAEEKLRAANLLLENNMFSDAISEAYYVMFHAAKALLALRSIYPKNACWCCFAFWIAVCYRRTH